MAWPTGQEARTRVCIEPEARYNTVDQNEYPPLQKYIIREKVLHHRHFLKYDTNKNQVHGYCQETGCRYRKRDVNTRLRTTEIKSDYYNDSYYQKYETKYPQNLLDAQESPKNSESLKYILKPILYSRIDEYFVENEKADALNRLQRHQDAKAKAEIIKNFQELYESHCRLIEAQNIFIHEHMELNKARQLLQTNNEKARWMENHAQVFSSRQQKLANHVHVFQQHRKVEKKMEPPSGLTFKQYVSSLWPFFTDNF